jgi:uncharacterized membrane protein HdeD (DUF308 family)
MTTNTPPQAKHLMLTGIVLIVFGVIAIATPAVAGTAVVMVIGTVLLITGVVQFVQGLRAESWSSRLLPLIQGAIAAICGLGLLGEPWIGMKLIALLLAIFFVMEGIWKIIASFSYRPASGWLLILASGVIALVLGLLIWRQWPVSGLWAVGILVGVDLLMTGVSMVALAASVRRIATLSADSSVA